jgi:hypothetical protein
MFKQFSKSLGLSAAAVMLSAVSANAASMTGDTAIYTIGGSDNFGSDPIEVKVSFKDLGNSIQVDLNVLPETDTGNIADLRGFFFDVANESLLPGLSFTGSDITDSQKNANSVINLGGGANLSGGGNYKFDAAVELGGSGIGGNDIRSTSFIIAHTSADLSIEEFTAGYIGVRATSTGAEGSGRGGSSKTKKNLVGVIPDTEPTPGGGGGGNPASVPEPAALLGLAAIGAVGTKLKRGQDDTASETV